MRGQDTHHSLRLPKSHRPLAHLDPGCLFPATPEAPTGGPATTSAGGAPTHCSEGHRQRHGHRRSWRGSSSCCFPVGDGLL